MINFEGDKETFACISKNEIRGLRVLKTRIIPDRTGWSVHLLTFDKEKLHWIEILSTLDLEIAKKWIIQCKEFANEKNRTEQQKIDIRAEQLALEKNLDYKQFTNDILQ